LETADTCVDAVAEISAPSIAIMNAVKTAAKVITFPVWMGAKYNTSIGIKDNAICTLLWAGYDYIAETTETLAKNQAAQAKSRVEDEKFPEWFKTTYPDNAYSVETAKASDGYEVKLHMSRPPQNVDSAAAPTILNFHGGGMCKGSPFDTTFKALLERYGSSAVIVSADYRLAYEGSNFPDAIEDAIAAVRHCSEHSSKLILTGYSAGGYLTVAAALKAKEENIQLHHVLPIAPSTHIDVDGSRAASEVGKTHGELGYFSSANSMPNEAMNHMWQTMWVKPEDRNRKEHDLRTYSYSDFAKTTVIAFEGDATSGEAIELHNTIIAAGGKSSLVREGASHVLGGIFALSYDSVAAAFDEALGAS